MRLRLLRTATIALTLVIAFPAVAYANVGLPMIVLVLPAGVLSLPIVVVAEALVLMRFLDLHFWRAMKIETFAKLLSSVVGIPLVWGVLVLLEMLLGWSISQLGWRANLGEAGFLQDLLVVVFTAPWPVPRQHPPSWIVPTAALVLLVPFFFASWWIEVRVVRSMCPLGSAASIRRAVWMANALSYCGFAVATSSWLLWSVIR